MNRITRRTFMGSLGAAATMPAFSESYAAPTGPVITRAIPSTGEKIPMVGLGTWITFNVGNDERLRAARAQVMQAFFDRGGTLVDSSPMYGSSEGVVGYGLSRTKRSGQFCATKVWTMFKPLGVSQMETSRKLWGVERFDLLQVHNLLDWSTHLATLKEMKAQGRVRYIGVTTSQGWRHGDLASVMRTEPIDFVQFTYNVADREVEDVLLPLAAERGIAVIINRPFQEGALINKMMNYPLPPWAAEIDCTTWAQFLLKFVISHPAVTCVIPATRRVDHVEENTGAMRGRLPDARMRLRMLRHAENV